jgi:hypothetical protein
MSAEHEIASPQGTPPALAGAYSRITCYEVSVFPGFWRDGGDRVLAESARTWCVTVEDRGHGKWAVCRGPSVLGTDGTWDWEMRPGDREDEWLATHRFGLEAALRLAAEWAPRVTINGMTALDILARHGERP